MIQKTSWNGLLVVAVDKTTLTLPEDLWGQFGSHKRPRADGPTQCQAAVLYDLHSRIPLRAKIGPSKEQDRSLLKRLLPSVAPQSLVILDAGFYSIEILFKILQRAAHFLIPMRINGHPKRIKNLGGGDGLYQIHASRYWKCQPLVPQTMTVRIVTVYRNGFRPKRLVTSLLDPIAFPGEQIATLYHERWHLETFFRELKHTLKAQCWHARTSHAFYIEFVFFMLLATLTRLTMLEADSQHRIPHASLSFGKSLGFLKRALELTAYIPISRWYLLYNDLLDQLARSTIDARPNRFFERDLQKRRRKRRTRFILANNKRIIQNGA